jgi:hypothetical protein
VKARPRLSLQGGAPPSGPSGGSGTFHLGEGVLQLLRVDAWLLEGTAPAAVGEGEQGGALHVVEEYDVAGVPGGQGAGGLRRNEVAAQAVHAQSGAEA